MDNIYNVSNQNEEYNNNISLSVLCIGICIFISNCFSILKCKKTKRISSENLLNKECSICLDNYNPTDKIIKLPCNHIYHQKCINEWFSKSKSCPMCRINI